MSEYGMGSTSPRRPDFLTTFYLTSPALQAVVSALWPKTVANASLLSVASTMVIAVAAGVSRKQARKIKKRAQQYLHYWHRGRE